MMKYIPCLHCELEDACSERRKLHPDYLTIYDVVFRNAWAKCDCPIYIALTAGKQQEEAAHV